MRRRARRTTTVERPDVTGTLRVAGSAGSGLPELEPGDVLVLDLADLHRSTAEAIADARVGAVVNAGRLRVGRYANLGPRVLADADVVWIDGVGRETAQQLIDGATVQVRRGAVHLVSPDAPGSISRSPVAVGRELDLAALADATPAEPQPSGLAGAGADTRPALQGPTSPGPARAPSATRAGAGPAPAVDDEPDPAARADRPRGGAATGWRRAPLAVLVAAALLLGGAVGAGLVAVLDQPSSPTVGPGDDPSLRRSVAQAQASDRGAQSLLRAVAPRVYADGLAGHGVMVIGLPGATSSQVDALSAQVRAAGGAASRTVGLRPALLDPGNRSRIDTLDQQLLTQLADPRLDGSAGTYVLLGQLLALATTTTTSPVSAVADPVAVAIREALTSAGLAEFPADVHLAPLVLLVLPPDAAADRTRTGPLADLVDGLGTTATAVVVAGDTAAGRPGGALAGLRTHSWTGPVSTVDGVDRPAGQVSTVLALEAALTGTTGAYGAVGADGPVPPTG